MKKTVNLTYTIAAIVAVIVCIFSIFVQSGARIARAATTLYPDVLEDLRTDSEFNIKDYPANPDDYSIYVLQIAESQGGNLYVYTYQPCQNTKKLTATDINLSLSEDVAEPQLYSLRLINSNGVFCKYLVVDFKVSSKVIRYYNITSIYRAWDSSIDGDSDNDNVINKKAHAVGKVYTATTMRGEVIYDCQPTYVVNILNPYVDYLSYTLTDPDFYLDFLWDIIFDHDKWKAIDSHYIAFSTDLEIDNLISADLHYYYRTVKGVSHTILGFINTWDKIEYGPSADTTVTVTADKVSVSDRKWYGRGHSYTWDRIQTVEEFLLKEPTLTEQTIQNIKDNQWVLRFAETERTFKETEIGSLYNIYEVNSTEVNNVTILRLEFETDGIVYNLGAVNDVVSGDDSPGNEAPEPPNTGWDKVKAFFSGLFEPVGDFFSGVFESIGDYFKGLFGIKIPWWVYLVVGLAILGLLILVISPVKKVLKAILNGLLWLILLPFKALKKLFTKKE